MLDNFTRRHRLDYQPCDLRYEYIPSGFRYDLFKLLLEDAHEEEGGFVREYYLYRALSIAISKDYFQCVNADQIYDFYTTDLLVELIIKSKWHELLSLIEEIVERTSIPAKKLNELLSYHNVGYELTCEGHRGPWQVHVKYTTVVEDMERSLEAAAEYPAIVELIASAKKSLADPKNIDIANSIKNSVSALEGYMIEWLQKTHSVKAATLGDAVKEIKSRKLADQNIIESLHQFYIYRNRTPNVGHGSVSMASFSDNDALLINEMAISYINYFSRNKFP